MLDFKNLMSKLKIIIVTQDVPFYLPTYLDKVLSKLGPEGDVIKVFALPPDSPKMGYYNTLKYYFEFFGTIVFFYLAFVKMMYGLCNFLNSKLKIPSPIHSVELVCQKHKVAFSKIDTINSKKILGEVKDLQPDIILSLAAPEVFCSDLLSIPRLACLNIHSSLLPQYRGINANFWVLAKGETETGVTIHYMNSGIDSGRILLQKKIEIEENWSLHSLYLKVIDIGSDMIAECINTLSTGKMTTFENKVSEGAYFTYPTRKDAKEFRLRKKKFFRFY